MPRKAGEMRSDSSGYWTVKIVGFRRKNPHKLRAKCVAVTARPRRIAEHPRDIDGLRAGRRATVTTPAVIRSSPPRQRYPIRPTSFRDTREP